MLRTPVHLVLIGILLGSVHAVQGQGTQLLRDPTVSSDHIVFAYASDLWIVDRNGGEAERLTSFPGVETNPHFSPDGRHVAFTGQYEGDTDAFVVPTEGGAPRRITHHPSGDYVQGWTTDGLVLVQSARQGGPRLKPQMWTVDPNTGGLPERVPVPRAYAGDLHANGQQLAYELVDSWDPEWRNYRGGQAQPIRILDLETMSLQKLPWDGSRDREPVWLGDTVYFLSDRDLAMNVWAYNTESQSLTQVTSHDEYDVKGIDAGGGVIVYEQAGYLHVHDPSAGTTEQLEIHVRGDLPWTRPDWKDVTDNIQSASLSPTGKRALIGARGEVFTVPTEHGDWRNLTESSGARDRTPAWSPDGSQIAWVSDASGEYQLYIADQKGLSEPRVIDLPGPTFYYDLQWSPDGSHLLFTDTDLNIWTLNVETEETTKVDTDQYASPGRTIDAEWSPDGNWIAYSKQMDNLHNAIMLYSTESGETTRVTSSMVHARSPTWDVDGDELYFFASTNRGLDGGWLDMSSYGRPTTHGIYAAVLSEDGASPLLPRSDEEPTEEEGGSADGREGDPAEDPGAEDGDVDIDLEGIGNRIVSLGVDKRIYSDLQAGPSGALFFLKQPAMDGPPSLLRYDMEERAAQPFLERVQQFTLSHDRKQLLYQSGSTWGVVPTAGNPSTGDGALTLDLQARIHPPSEWEQIFREAWRYQRDFLYVENTHGADWSAVYDRYRPWLASAQHRADLNYVLDVMGGEVSIGHSYTGGGDYPDVDQVAVGLLGADYEMANERYRFARIYEGEAWTDEAGPLAAPGVDVAEGDYLLAVNGESLTSDENLYAAFEETAGRQVIITVNDAPTMEGAREVTVVPTSSERALRRIAWIEDNRAKVDSLSDGDVGYVYVPNTGGGGYASFTREYFAQQRHEAIIIDERWNGGGSAADYMVNIMNRRLLGYFNNPVEDRTPFTLPGAGHFGPKVMIVNEMAGSGGDLLPYMFRKMDLGPIVGTRTWGGLVGIWGVPPLIDGGAITAPRGGFFNTDGEWDVENEGVAPDIEVEMTPRLVENGEDPQLQRAVEEALRLLDDENVTLREEPEPPVRARRPNENGQ
jgi:tricorn protease